MFEVPYLLTLAAFSEPRFAEARWAAPGNAHL